MPLSFIAHDMDVPWSEDDFATCLALETQSLNFVTPDLHVSLSSNGSDEFLVQLAMEAASQAGNLAAQAADISMSSNDEFIARLVAEVSQIDRSPGDELEILSQAMAPKWDHLSQHHVGRIRNFSPADVSVRFTKRRIDDSSAYSGDAEEDSVEDDDSDDEYRPPTLVGAIPEVDYVQNPTGTKRRRRHVLIPDLFFLNPMRLQVALEEIESGSLRPETWIGHSSIDFMCFSKAQNIRNPQFLYIPTTSIPVSSYIELGKGPAKEEVQDFRNLFPHLPQNEVPCPMQNLVYILHYNENHFSTLVIVPSDTVVYLFCRNVEAESFTALDDDWNSWDGRRILGYIWALLGWDVKLLDALQLFSLNWKQNGYDCGPIATQIAIHILQHGLLLEDDGRWKRPPFPCCHSVRISMLEGLHHRILRSMERFEENLDLIKRCLPTVDWIAQFNAHQDLKRRLVACRNFVPQMMKIETELRGVMKKCPVCMSAVLIALQSEHEPPNQHVQETSSTAPPAIFASNSANKHATDHLSTRRRVQAALQHRIQTPNNWKQCNPRRFPRPEPTTRMPTLQEVPLKVIRAVNQLRSFDSFDDYYNGPTTEVQEFIKRRVFELGPNVAHDGGGTSYVPASIWTLFQDYGYRIQPDFAQAFDGREPLALDDHILPIGLEKLPATLSEYIPAMTARNGSTINITDRLVVGLQSFLDLAEDNQSDDILVTGRTQENKFIALDLLEDAIEDVRLDFSCDIDSLIWITCQPRFQNAISVFLTPVIRDTAPIFKSNGVSVDVLLPRPEGDALGSRSSWETQSFNLSQIPHLLVANIPAAASSAEVLLFFPRMIHKNPHHGYYATNIPKNVQDLFWNHVLLRALKKATPSTRTPYIDVNQAHSFLKRGRGMKETSTVLEADFVEFFFEEMKRIISDVNNDDAFTLFGSMFVVVQIKGSKSLAHAQRATFEECISDAVNKFRRCFNALDFEYMNDRTAGELFCDVGVTIQPSDPSSSLIGLWRLDSLEASLGAGGFPRGNLHTINTLSMYGAIQSEMGKARRSRTHISAISFYNLGYEVVRSKKNDRTRFDEAAMLGRTPSFHKQVREITQVLKDVASVEDPISYGVRMEMKCGYEVLKLLGPLLDKKVSKFLDTGPVTWLPAATWFGFLRRRLHVLHDLHGKIYQQSPKNFPVINGLISYLMQSVLFTPPKVNKWTSEALNLMRYQDNCNYFGVFFLDELDLDNIDILPTIVEVEARDLLQILKLPKLPSRKAQPRRVSSAGDDMGAADFPLGPEPSWREVTQSLRDNPTILIGPWTGVQDGFNEDLYLSAEEGSPYHLASRLFVSFTTHLWLKLNPVWRINPNFDIHPQSPIEALNCWSVDFCLDSTVGAVFRPLNLMAQGRHGRSFGSRRDLYFPSLSPSELPRSWRDFAEIPGYIATYIGLLNRLNEDDRDCFHESLEALLGQCQCLPESVRNGTSGYLWHTENERVIFITNADHYRIRRINTKSQTQRVIIRAPAAHRPVAEVQLKLIMLEQGVDESSAKRALSGTKLKRNAERSGAANNKRNPPGRSLQPKNTNGRGVRDQVDADVIHGKRSDREDEPEFLNDDSLVSQGEHSDEEDEPEPSDDESRQDSEEGDMYD